MLNWKNFLFRLYLKLAYPVNFSREKSLIEQGRFLKKIIGNLKDSALGKDLHFSDIKDYHDFTKAIPVTTYNFYESYVNRICNGEKNVMFPQKVEWLAKTAGTTSGKSKLIPISDLIIQKCHVRGSFISLALIHHFNKKLDLLGHQNLLIPGGIYESIPTPGIRVADISAIMVRNVPSIYRKFYVPNIATQTKANWEEKISATVEEIENADVGTISGVPTWHLAILQKLKAKAKFDKLIDQWKNLQVFFHGGVSFEPYRQQFAELIGKEDFVFYEIYNATEGFFGVQENLNSRGLLLLTDNYIFYEFIPLAQFHQEDYSVIPLSEVKTDVPYVILITAPNGLLRYIIGDVVTFDKTNPFVFRITGRTQEYINAFGEDLLLMHVESALMKCSAQFDCLIRDYTVAPLYISMSHKGKMQFAIEFSKPPQSVDEYATALDKLLQQENSNYKQKRTGDIALSALEVIVLPEGTFYQWLSSKGKLGGQNKVPRLVNGRKMIEEVLACF